MCVNLQRFFVGTNVPNIVLDFLILIAPLHSIWRLRLPNKRKIIVSGNFDAGGWVSPLSHYLSDYLIRSCVAAKSSSPSCASPRSPASTPRTRRGTILAPSSSRRLSSPFAFSAYVYQSWAHLAHWQHVQPQQRQRLPQLSKRPVHPPELWSGRRSQSAHEFVLRRPRKLEFRTTRQEHSPDYLGTHPAQL